jgi:uncharacterized protein
MLLSGSRFLVPFNHARPVDGPSLDKPLVLQFQGDWGQANLHRICGWLAQEVYDRTPEGTRIATWSGRGGADAVTAVMSGLVDMAMMTPAYLGRCAREGTAIFAGSPQPALRAIGTLPQDDRLIFAIDADLGIRSFAEIRSKKPALRIATSHDDRINTVGYAAQTIMKAHGISREEFERWGGEYVEDERPFPPLRWFRDGEVDAVLHEAIMSPEWQEAARTRRVTYVPMEESALSDLEERFGWPRGIVPAGYLPGLDRDLVTLDFSDFLAVVRGDMPNDVAYLLAWCMGETGAAIERQYRHIPAERSPVGYPLDPKKIAQTSIPLHPGARRYYVEHGHTSGGAE